MDTPILLNIAFTLEFNYKLMDKKTTQENLVKTKNKLHTFSSMYNTYHTYLRNFLHWCTIIIG